MKRHFMCVEQSTSTIIMHGEVKVIMKFLKMSVIQRRSMCGALWWKMYQSFRF